MHFISAVLVEIHYRIHQDRGSLRYSKQLRHPNSLSAKGISDINGGKPCEPSIFPHLYIHLDF